jgi:hypothetical protein
MFLVRKLSVHRDFLPMAEGVCGTLVEMPVFWFWGWLGGYRQKPGIYRDGFTDGG